MADYDPTCSEIQDPPLSLGIQGQRWMGGEFETVGNPVEISLSGTDTDGDERTILLALRRLAVTRFDMNLSLLLLKREQLDFDAPNQPTENDIGRLVNDVERLLGFARVLRELAPEVVEPDEGED